MAKKKKTTTTNLRTIACIHLKSLDEVSMSGQPLCECKKRDFVMAPFNLVCQVCKLYKENAAELLHKDMYVANAAPDFIYDFDEIDSRIELDEEIPSISDDLDPDEDEEIVVKPKKKGKTSKKKKKAADDDDDDDLEIEEITEDISDGIEGPIIGVTDTEEEEESLDYEDEAEEGLGKKHGKFGQSDDDDEDEEELEEDIEEFEGEDDGGADFAGDGGDYDFQAEVIEKIKKTGEKEICPFCHKSKASVLRHLSKCAKAPPEAINGLKQFRIAQKKKPTKKAKKP